MPNRFFTESDIRTSAETAWRSTLAEELRFRKPVGDLHAAAVYSTPEIYLYEEASFKPYGAKLVLHMQDDGLGAGLYVERGYLWAAESGWTLQPHWDWHHFLHLFGNDPGFQALFHDARASHEGFAFWIQSGEADDEELSVYASKAPIATLHALLATWPGHLWCDVYFSTLIPKDILLQADDEEVLKAIAAPLTAVAPIYWAIVNRRRSVKPSAFGG